MGADKATVVYEKPRSESPPGSRRIVLAGNPNCGKSVLFNRITGLYVDVSNFPGTTVDVARGRWLGAELIDTPGVYGLGSYSDEERISRDIVLQADVVINVVNGTTLERDLFLTLQLVDAGLPLIVVVNMMDEVERLGMSIDIAALSEALGVPVIPVVAITGEGLEELTKAVAEPRRGRSAAQMRQTVDAVRKHVEGLGKKITQAESLLIAEGDETLAHSFGIDPGEERTHLYAARRRRADLLVADVVRDDQHRSLGMVLGELATHPLIGLPILAVILWGVYWVVGVFVAQIVVDYTEGIIMRGMYEPAIRGWVASVIAPNSVMYRILVGEFGVLTMTVTYALGLLLPLVAGFYLMLAILEDSGYLPRVAVLTDRFLNHIGLNGRAVIPMILGFGCVTAATLTTRVLASRRERVIAAALLGIVIPCSAQLAVITALVTPLGSKATLLYVLTLLLVYGLLGLALNKLLPGEPTDLLLDLPPLRWPRLANVAKKTANRVVAFLEEAVPFFAIGALAITLMQETGVLGWIERVVYPVTVGWLRLPPETARAFVMGLVRRDFGAAGLYELAMTPHQTLVAVITITLFVPCIASVLVLLKELGLAVGASIFVGAVVIATAMGGLMSRFLTLLPL